jgi:1,4-dihydroxy-2-naphthoate octaprenyltransferase
MMNCPEKTFALRLGYKKAMIYEIILLQLPILLMLMFLMINFAQDQRSYYPFIVMILIFFYEIKKNHYANQRTKIA